MKKPEVTRRDVLALALAAGLAPPRLLAEDQTMLTRAIPSSGERLPVIGLGTWQVFDVEGTPEEVELRRRIVALLVSKGGSVIDTSPMYDRSERIIGEVIKAGVERDALFLATKVWTDGKDAGERQMRRSAERMRTDVLDLVQVHNRRDLAVQLATIREWQAAGRIRYNGVTDYRASALAEMEAIMRRERPDFIQINYSLGEREADRRVLSLAAELGIAVLVNRPYLSGRLFRATRGRELPAWARSFAASWGQFFLKYIVSHPAVTCVIPATSRAAHMRDNIQAGFGKLPDEKMRARMIKELEG